MSAPFVGVATLAAATVLFVRAVRRAGRRGGRTRRLDAALLALALAWTLVVVEALFAGFAVESHGLAFTLAAQRWFEEHWHPVNRWGYRDPEPKDAALAVTRRLYVLGDSIASGQGVDRVGDRLPDRLRDRLGPGWTVLTLARPGWGTQEEKQALLEAPLPPHFVVLVWCVNDVSRAAERHGVVYAPDLAPRPRWLAPLVEGSHLANFVYWRVRAFVGDGFGDGYYAFLDRSFGDAAIVDDHVTELLDLVATVQRQGSGFLAVLFPELSAVGRSAPESARIADRLRAAGVSVLDLGPRFEGRDPRTLRASAVDTHPNAAVHAEVAGLVLERLAAEGALR